MTERQKIWLGAVVLVFLGAGVCYGLYKIFTYLSAVENTMLIAILTAATTVIAATVAVVLAKHYERKMNIEAEHRQKKIEIYDQFLKEIFHVFFGNKSTSQRIEKRGDRSKQSLDLVEFLREWQRKLILWGGQDVLNAYSLWKNHMQSISKEGKSASVETVMLMEKLFFEIRKDIGNKNNKLKEGIFIDFIMKETDVVMEKYKENPNTTLEEIAKSKE